MAGFLSVANTLRASTKGCLLQSENFIIVQYQQVNDTRSVINARIGSVC